MRYRIPQSAYCDPRLRGEDRRVLGALEAYTDRDGYCWPAQGRIARDLGMHRPNVNRAIRRLEEYGYVARAGRSGRRSCNYYLLMPTKGSQELEKTTSAPAPQDTARSAKPSPEPRERDAEPKISSSAPSSETALDAPCPYGAGRGAADDTQSCITGDTQTDPLNGPPPIVPPRKRAGDKRGAGRAPGTPPPDPRPSDRGGGAAPRAPEATEGAIRGIARQAGRSKTRATEQRRLSPCQRAMTYGDVMSSGMARDMWKRVYQLSEAGFTDPEERACEELGFDRQGYWKGGRS